MRVVDARAELDVRRGYEEAEAVADERREHEPPLAGPADDDGAEDAAQELRRAEHDRRVVLVDGRLERVEDLQGTGGRQK